MIEPDHGEGKIAGPANWFRFPLRGVIHSVGFLHGRKLSKNYGRKSRAFNLALPCERRRARLRTNRRARYIFKIASPANEWFTKKAANSPPSAKFTAMARWS